MSAEKAADALLRAIILDRMNRTSVRAGPIVPTPYVYRPASEIPLRSEPDLNGLALLPVETACRAELRRVGQIIRRERGLDGIHAAADEISDMDADNFSRRMAILDSVWSDIWL
jgi:hypothetical protein